jgi:hypothetical protein
MGLSFPGHAVLSRCDTRHTSVEDMHTLFGQ